MDEEPALHHPSPKPKIQPAFLPPHPSEGNPVGVNRGHTQQTHRSVAVPSVETGLRPLPFLPFDETCFLLIREQLRSNGNGSLFRTLGQETTGERIHPTDRLERGRESKTMGHHPMIVRTKSNNRRTNATCRASWAIVHEGTQAPSTHHTKHMGMKEEEKEEEMKKMQREHLALYEGNYPPQQERNIQPITG